jgi:TetR/AcrR family transcriptional repressor of nem operon
MIEPAAERPSDTRAALLKSAFEEIYERGFEASRLNVMLKRAGAAKGSLYHFFTGKQDLGRQAVAHYLGEFLETMWLAPMETVDNPIDGLRAVIDHFFSDAEEHRLIASPLQKLADELGSRDESLRVLLNNHLTDLRTRIAFALKSGQDEGAVDPYLDPQAAAVGIIGMAGGVLSQLNICREPEFADLCRQSCLDFIERLRP